MVVFDATMLLFIFSDHVGTPTDATTAKPIDRPKDRIDLLLKNLQREQAKIIIPTPAIAEILVRAGRDAAKQLERINSSKVFRIAPFDVRAAVQVALMARAPGDKPKDRSETYAKIKYDRQIAAIAKVEGASVIYSDDENVRSYAKRLGLKAVSLAELPLPPSLAPKEPDLLDWVGSAPNAQEMEPASRTEPAIEDAKIEADETENKL